MNSFVIGGLLGARGGRRPGRIEGGAIRATEGVDLPSVPRTQSPLLMV